MNEHFSRRESLAAVAGLALNASLLPSVVEAHTAEQKDLIFRTTDPRNGEPDLAKLGTSWLLFQLSAKLFQSNHAKNSRFLSSKSLWH